MRCWMGMVVLVGCSSQPEEVTLVGEVGASEQGGDIGLSGATIELFDSTAALYATADTSTSGAFEIVAPATSLVFMDIHADGYTTSSFMGIAGIELVQNVEPGSVYGFPESTFQTWQNRFSGCSGIGEDGAVVGEVRVSDLEDADSGEHPLVATATVQVESESGDSWGACYLNDDGTAYDPAVEQTGASGQFAVFGVPAGVHTLVVGFEVVEGQWKWEEYPLRVTETSVAPRFPTWVLFDP